MSRDHRKLEVFHLADELVLMVYQATRSFPRDEVFGLRSQIRRAAVSIAANIVEGCARTGQREYVNMLNITLGSAREVGYYIDLTRRLGFLSDENAHQMQTQYDRTAGALNALICSLQKSKLHSDPKPQVPSLKPLP